MEIMAPLKYLRNFQITLETPLINCEIDLIITSSEKCVLSNSGNEATAFPIADAKLYVPVLTLSTQNNAKLFRQLKSGFKRTTNSNKIQSKVTIQPLNPYLDYEIDPTFQGVNIISVLSLENNENRTSYKQYFFSNLKNKRF